MNGFDDGEMNNHVVYETLSRVNHSCAPNCCILDNTLVAMRKIQRDDELTICYFNPMENVLQDSKNRKNLLLSGWGFGCQCEVCQCQPKELDQNDKLRMEAASFSTVLASPSHPSTSTCTNLMEAEMNLLILYHDLNLTFLASQVLVDINLSFSAKNPGWRCPQYLNEKLNRRFGEKLTKKFSERELPNNKFDTFLFYERLCKDI